MPDTPRHCAGMKRMWTHIAECKTYKKGCLHCHDARHLLTHYRGCKDGNCSICGPVREVVRREKERKRGPGDLVKTDTYTTAPSTTAAATVLHPPSPPHQSTIDEWVACHRLTVIDCPQRGRWFPSGSVSSLSHDCGSSVSSLRSSVRSSAPGSVRSGDRGNNCNDGGATKNGEIYCSECRKMGWPRVQRRCSGGIRCRNNLGIAHFCKDTLSPVVEEAAAETGGAGPVEELQLQQSKGFASFLKGLLGQ